jgi:hypothetical protein
LSHFTKIFFSLDVLCCLDKILQFLICQISGILVVTPLRRMGHWEWSNVFGQISNEFGNIGTKFKDFETPTVNNEDKMPLNRWPNCNLLDLELLDDLIKQKASSFFWCCEGGNGSLMRDKIYLGKTITRKTSFWFWMFREHSERFGFSIKYKGPLNFELR